jgi:hypothetical protein
METNLLQLGDSFVTESAPNVGVHHKKRMDLYKVRMVPPQDENGGPIR